LKARKNPLWRKIIIVVFLPIIIIVWTFGWALTILGDNSKTTEIKKASRNVPEFEVTNKEMLTSDENSEESRVRYEPEITA
jgi:glucose-6-phosphate-specific signal transduction histidine kinase